MEGCSIYVIAMTSLVLMTSAVYGEMDQKMKDYILKIHNDYRKGEGASNMAELVWDSQMEQEAQTWANGCVFKHKGMGENLAWNSATADPEGNIKNAMQHFFDEKNMYSYGQNSCGSSCHYSQLVWADTMKVGCATKICTPLGNSGWGKEAWYLVCRYDPAGNWNGKKPYEKGSCADDKCPGGGKCSAEGLCQGGKPGAGATGGGAAGPCKDDQAQCADWAKRGECGKNPKFMEKSCRKSCKKC